MNAPNAKTLDTLRPWSWSGKRIAACVLKLGALAEEKQHLRAASRTVPVHASGAAHKVDETRIVSLQHGLMQRTEHLERQGQQLQDERDKRAEDLRNAYLLIEELNQDLTDWDERHNNGGRAVMA